MKENYPLEDSRYLPLVAIACFLIDKGCDWLATSKKNRTAAVEVDYWLGFPRVANIFKTECLRHYLTDLVKNGSIDQLQLMAGNCMDQLGRSRSIETTEGTVE